MINKYFPSREELKRLRLFSDESYANEIKDFFTKRVVPSLNDKIEKNPEQESWSEYYLCAKDYDIMVAQYFNDIYDVLRETYRVLKPGAHFLLVLGDSAPYGVHVPTGMYIAEIARGKGIGFSSYQIEELRKRGGKWKDNPQRHKVPLREGLVILKK